MIGTIDLPNGSLWDLEKPFSEQTEDAQAFATDLKNYDQRDIIAKTDTNGQYKDWAINLSEYEIVRRKRWVDGKPVTDEIFVRANDDDWTQDRPLRAYLQDSTIAIGIENDSNFKAVIDYALNPPEGVLILKERIGAGWMVYLNVIEPAHEAILNAHGVQVILKN